jgi:excisionase family DNA binding protein
MFTEPSNINSQVFFSNNLTTPEAARYLNFEVSTLEQWRWNGRGPRFVKIGRYVRYRLSDLDAFLEERVFASTTEAQAARRESG